MKNTNLFNQNDPLQHWNRENRVIFEEQSPESTETPQSQTVTGQDIINAASAKKDGKWETDWKLVNILREKQGIDEFRKTTFALNTVSSKTDKNDFLEKLNKIAEKKREIKEKSIEKRQEVNLDIRATYLKETYTVQKGDSLKKIAKDHTIRLNELIAFNQTYNDAYTGKPKAGDTILIPYPGFSVGEIAPKAEKHAEETATVIEIDDDENFIATTGIEQGSINTAQECANKQRVKDFSESAKEKNPEIDEAKNIEKGKATLEKLLNNLNGALSNHSEAVRKLSTYQGLADLIKLDENNITTLFGIQVSSSEGLIGLFKSGNVQKDFEKLLNKKFPKTQDDTNWQNITKEIGKFLGKSGIATALANGINYLAVGHDPNLYFALIKLGEINTGIQSGRLEGAIKETDLLFLGEFMRLSKIIENPKDDNEKKQAEEALKKLIADEKAGTTNYTLIAENIARGRESFNQYTTEDLPAIEKNIAQALGDASLSEAEKEFFQTMQSHLSQSIEKGHADIDDSRKTVDAELKKMEEEFDDLLGGLKMYWKSINVKFVPIPIPALKIRELGHFLKTFGGIKEEELSKALTHYRDRLDSMMEKKMAPIKKEKIVQRILDVTKDVSFTQFNDAIRTIYGKDATKILIKAYDEYVQKNEVDENSYDKRYQSLVTLAENILFPEFKRSFPDTPYIEIGGKYPDEFKILVENTDVIIGFTYGCVEERALDQLGKEFRSNYENLPHKEEFYRDMLDSLDQAGSLEKALLRAGILNSFIGKALAPNLTKSIGEDGLNALTQLAQDIQWAENLADTYENMDLEAMYQNVEIHPAVPQRMKQIMELRTSVVTMQKRTSEKLFEAIANEDKTEIQNITHFYTENAGDMIKEIRKVADKIDELQKDKKAIIEAHDENTEVLALSQKQYLEKEKPENYEDLAVIANACISANEMVKEMAPDDGIPVSLSTFVKPETSLETSKDQATDFEALLNTLKSIDPQCLTDWTKFESAMKKMGIDLTEHKTPATTSRYGMVEGPNGKIGNHYANNINMLMLLLPERYDRQNKEGLKPPIPETIREVGNHLGLNLTNSEIMNAVAQGNPTDTANLPEGTSAPYLNIGVNYYPTELDKKNYNFKPKGYQVAFERTFFTPDGELTVTYEIMLRDKCFNVNIPQKEAIKAVLKKYPPTPEEGKPEYEERAFASYIPNLFPLYAGWYWKHAKERIKAPGRIKKEPEIPEVISL